MTTYIQTIDKFAIGLTKTVINYKYLVALVMIGLTMAIASGGSLLGFTPNYRAYFSDENPELMAFESFQNTYTKNDNFFFVLEPKDGNVFSQETLKAVKDLTKKAWTIPFANRVDSITNFQNTYADRDGLVVEDLVNEVVETLDSNQLKEKQSIAINEPLIKGQLITADARATGVNVVLQLPGKSLYEVPTAAAKAREFKNHIETTYPNINVSLTGFGMLNNAFGESAYMDSTTLVPIMYGVLIFSTLLILRSLIGTIITLVIAYLSVGVGMGVGGFSGVLLTPVSTSVPIIILTLAIADSIHVFLSIKKLMRSGMSKLDAIVESMRINFMPVTITSLTTIVGFVSLNLSDSPPYWHLGNLSAAGIAAAWLLSIILLPALMAILPYREKTVEGKQFSDQISERLGSFVINNSKMILALGLLSTTVLFTLVPSIQFNDQWSDYFDESIEFRRDTDEATRFFGLYPIEYSVPAKASQGISDTEYLNKLSEFTDFLRTQPYVTHVFSITDILKRLNKNLHGDAQEYYKLPETQRNTADYLLVYELSLPYGLDLNDRINIDKSATRVTVTLGKTSTMQTKSFLDNTEQWIQKNFPEYMQNTKPTSAHVMFTYITDRNVNSMISGTILAIILIAIVLALALRSVSLGLLSLLSNGLPIIASFGVWALLVGSVGFSVAAVAAISLGIVVDDTVHFLSKYQLGKNEKNYSAEDSVIYAYKSVGPAMVSSTVILLCGFAVMASSTFKMNTDLGLLTAITIAFALIYDLLLLPAILILSERKKNISATGESVLGKATIALLGALSLSFATISVEKVHAEEVRSLEKGYQISALSDRSDRGFASSEVEVTMILRNASGDEAKRVLDVKTLEMPNENVGDKSIVIFREPADISGTALLSHAKILKPDNQWLLLKSMNRVKRISSRNKSGPFMGSEFAFEDFTSLELNKYSHEWIKEEACANLKCNVIKRVPQYEFSGYSYLLVWIDEDVYQVRKIEFYDRKGDLLKTLTLEDYKNYNGYWRAHFWQMENHQTRKFTDLLFGEYAFKVGLLESGFVKERLKHIN